MESNNEFKLYAKTGMGSHDGACYGWYVGWVEKGEDVYFFATNIESADYNNLLTGGRKGITMEIMKDIGILDKQN